MNTITAPKRLTQSAAPVQAAEPAPSASVTIIERAERAVAQATLFYETALKLWGVLKPLVVPITLVFACFLVAVMVIQSALFIGHLPFVPTILQTAGLVLVFRKGKAYLFSEGRAEYAGRLSELFKQLTGR